MSFSTWILASRQWHRVDHLYQDEGSSPNYPHLLQSPGLVGINIYLNQSCVKIGGGVLGSLSLTVCTVIVDVKQHSATKELKAQEQTPSTGL